jgi:hypothetical protein
MRSLYLTAETKIINEIVRKNQQGYVDYAEQAALERIRMTLQGMIDESWEYVPKMVEMQFKTANLVQQGYTNAKALTVPQTMIVEQLIQNLMGEIIESSTTAYNTSKMLYEVARLDNDVYRQTALLATAYNEAAGYGFMHGSETLEQMLNAKGITSFTDKAGRHWSLTDYCTMTSRTTARQAQVAAVLTKDEHDLYQIVKIGSTCPLCAVYEGRVYSKSGTDPHYPPLAAAFGKIDPAGSDDLSNTFLNIHPNCLVPGGSILGEGIVAESRRLYRGKVITLKTSRGNEITVTPNHPILTNRGFVEADRLVEGDKIIEASLKYTSLFGEAPNDINIPTVVDEKLHTLMKSLSSSSCCVKGSAEQFHGDGGTDSEINIILANAFGAHKRQIFFDGEIIKETFPSSKFRVIKLFADSSFTKVIIRTLHSLYSLVSGFGFVNGIKRIAVYFKELADLGERTTAHIGNLSKSISLIVEFKKMVKLFFVSFFKFFRNIIKAFAPMIMRDDNSKFFFNSREKESRKIEFSAEFRASEPLAVARIEELLSNDGLVISTLTHKETSYYDGYVYNFETKYNHYAYNNIITHNCLHSIVKYTEVGKTDKQINKIREFSSFETNPADHDPRTKKQIEAYRNKERNRAKLLSDIRQKNEYRDVLGSVIPQDIQRFRDLKKSDKWSEIKSEYRKAINVMRKEK